MNFLPDAINHLQTKRSLFHSEDDLKLALAFLIQELNPNWDVRLERPLKINMLTRNNEKIIARAPIDIVVTDDFGKVFPIELKYKTKKTQVIDENEEYILTNHGAADIGRYSFRKDIYRIESYKNENANCLNGYVFILTNDKTYYQNNVFEKNSLDKNFAFHHGWKIPKGDDSWNYDRIDSTKYSFDAVSNTWLNKKSEKHWTYHKNLYYKLDLRNEYQIVWQNYSRVGNSDFKFCLITI